MHDERFQNEIRVCHRQLLQQGVIQGEGREGDTRDWLYKVVDRMPAHAGELVELLSLFTYRTSPQLVKNFLLGQGKTDDARNTVVPMFTRWVEMPEIIKNEDEEEQA